MVWNYNYIEHTADLAAEITGDTPEDLIRASITVLKNILIEGSVSNSIKKRIEKRASSLEELIIDILSELNYQVLVKKWLFNEVSEIRLYKESEFWNAVLTVSGELYNSAKHIIKEEIKAVTYHNLNIRYENNKYITSLFFDV
jgi:SHS2 domain-containing protein